MYRDKRVRQSMTYLTDRKLIVKSVLFGLGEVVDSHIYLFRPEYDKSLVSYPFDRQKALALLGEAGYFANPVGTPQTLPAFSKADDASVSLEHRVRSYLSVNCVQCHQAGGAGQATWDARAWLSLDETALINGTAYNNGGNPANKLIIPGDAAHSIVLQRIRANGFSRMPPLVSRNTADGTRPPPLLAVVNDHVAEVVEPALFFATTRQ